MSSTRQHTVRCTVLSLFRELIAVEGGEILEHARMGGMFHENILNKWDIDTSTALFEIGVIWVIIPRVYGLVPSTRR